MTGKHYQELDSGLYTKFRRSLLREKGSERQRAFLQAVRGQDTLVPYIRNEVSTVGSVELPLFESCFSEDEFKDPPMSTEEELYVAWCELTPSIACRTSFWAEVTCRHIEEGRIFHSSCLAANGGSFRGGAERLDRALSDTTAGAPKMVDECVRTVLRRLGGLPEARGNRSVYVNCPFARAWWREKLVERAAGGDSDLAYSVRRVLRIKQEYWERLVRLTVSRNSVLGSEFVRVALVLALAKRLDDDTVDGSLWTANGLGAVCRVISNIQSSRELGILEPQELSDLMDHVVGAHS